MTLIVVIYTYDMLKPSLTVDKWRFRC